jgi:oxygen-independent coproporphyrinogen-3 oxidase
MQYPASDLVIDPVLIRKYDTAGPRYTSYPTADRFVEAFGESDLSACLAGRRVGGMTMPLSLYVHLPFCDTVCYYCACNKVATRDRGKSAQYIKYLERECGLLRPLLGAERTLCQVHWGGGTPTFLPPAQLEELVAALKRTFDWKPGIEASIEVDPRRVAPGTLALLAGHGFNRLSVGVQDFDPAVQAAVHRLQSEEETRRAIAEARASGFRSVNLDLIYGLPRQTLDGFNRTLDSVLALEPERIALYAYAHLPERFPAQRRIAEAELPSAETRLQILAHAIGRLTRAGYVYVGMDHFARADDDLAVAQVQGRLQRNFQGYSTHGGADLIGLGASAIGSLGAAYYQNHKELDDYHAALDADRLPVARGLNLDADDLVRRAVIQSLACHFCVSIEAIELSHLVDFRRYFAAEMPALRSLADDGLVELSPDWIVVTPRGRLMVRVICMVFDRYLRERAARAAYSKVL